MAFATAIAIMSSACSTSTGPIRGSELATPISAQMVVSINRFSNSVTTSSKSACVAGGKHALRSCCAAGPAWPGDSRQTNSEIRTSPLTNGTRWLTAMCGFLNLFAIVKQRWEQASSSAQRICRSPADPHGGDDGENWYSSHLTVFVLVGVFRRRRARRRPGRRRENIRNADLRAALHQGSHGILQRQEKAHQPVFQQFVVGSSSTKGAKWNATRFCWSGGGGSSTTRDGRGDAIDGSAACNECVTDRSVRGDRRLRGGKRSGPVGHRAIEHVVEIEATASVISSSDLSSSRELSTDA